MLPKKFAQSIPAGKVNSEKPAKAKRTIKKRPRVVIGYTSPYPTVVQVDIPNHIASKIFEILSGCAGPSTQYIIAELNKRKKMHNKIEVKNTFLFCLKISQITLNMSEK